MDTRSYSAARRHAARLGVAAVAASTVAGALLAAGPAFAGTASHHPAAATGISKGGYIVGFATDAAGTTSSWMLAPGGQLTTFQFPGGSDTQAFGINPQKQIVGSYLDGNGVQHGFVLTNPQGPKSHWQSIDDPNGIGSTVVNGINGAGDLVGFYTDAAGNTDGMLATP